MSHGLSGAREQHIYGMDMAELAEILAEQSFPRPSQHRLRDAAEEGALRALKFRQALDHFFPERTAEAL